MLARSRLFKKTLKTYHFYSLLCRKHVFEFICSWLHIHSVSVCFSWTQAYLHLFQGNNRTITFCTYVCDPEPNLPSIGNLRLSALVFSQIQATSWICASFSSLEPIKNTWLCFTMLVWNFIEKSDKWYHSDGIRRGSFSKICIWDGL